jgi:hypothetical protein
VWLDQVLPMYRKDRFAQEAVIGMWKSTNHRFRGITIFRRLPTLLCAADQPAHGVEESETAGRAA